MIRYPVSLNNIIELLISTSNGIDEIVYIGPFVSKISLDLVTLDIGNFIIHLEQIILRNILCVNIKSL